MRQFVRTGLNCEGTLADALVLRRSDQCALCPIGGHSNTRRAMFRYDHPFSVRVSSGHLHSMLQCENQKVLSMDKTRALGSYTSFEVKSAEALDPSETTNRYSTFTHANPACTTIMTTCVAIEAALPDDLARYEAPPL